MAMTMTMMTMTTMTTAAADAGRVQPCPRGPPGSLVTDAACCPLPQGLADPRRVTLGLTMTERLREMGRGQVGRGEQAWPRSQSRWEQGQDERILFFSRASPALLGQRGRHLCKEGRAVGRSHPSPLHPQRVCECVSLCVHVCVRVCPLCR